MSNKIKIARSTTRANLPPSLDYGELAFVNAHRLIVGTSEGTDFVVNDWNNLINVPTSLGGPGTDSSGDPILITDTEEILSTWPGSVRVTTLGTVTSGIWNAGVIPSAYGGTGLHFIGGANQMLGVNNDATALEYKTFTSTGGTITITNNMDHIDLSITANYLPLSGGTVTGDLTVQGNIYASRNDVVDFVDAPKIQSVEYGRVYVRAPDYRVVISTEYNQIGILGIASDTFGMSVGQVKDVKQVPIAIAGFVLAFVDKLYAPGTPLTCDKDGVLTKMLATEKKAYPERIIATFDRPELKPVWNGVQVRGRCWVKVA